MSNAQGMQRNYYLRFGGDYRIEKLRYPPTPTLLKAMTSQPEDQDRQRFERWISEPPIGMPIARLPEASVVAAGEYENYGVQLAWEAWQKGQK
jgi:hypothetical protein